MSTLILFNKPYQVLSQFSDKEGRQNLSHYISQKTVYPAGRLDFDSEGLLLLTDDGVYGKTRPAKVKIISEPSIWKRTPAVRFRQSIPTHWLSITITEGRNRQVRRMTAAVELPTLRLIRAQIGSWGLDKLKPGEYKPLNIHMPRKQTAHKKNHQLKTKKK